MTSITVAYFIFGFLPFWLPGAPNAQQWLIMLPKGLWNSSLVCKLFVMTCQTLRNWLDNIYNVFLQIFCNIFGVQGSSLWIPWTEPAELVLQGPVWGSAVCLNRTISLVQGSGKVSVELDQTGPRHHYCGGWNDSDLSQTMPWVMMVQMQIKLIKLYGILASIWVVVIQ